MVNRLAKYHQVTALAAKPTPFRRLVAALVAGSLAFALTELLLVIWGAGTAAVFFSSIALAVAAAVAAVTTKRAMAVSYGIVAAICLPFEGLVVALGCIASVLG